ncbi:MAG: DedA family protein [Bacteroidota bacterium]|nr:DedA family protein [Bacteroidota bacterium]
MEVFIEWSYFGLFIASFLAGSILPFSSELVLSGLLAAGANRSGCLLAATAGNFLGGMTCFWIGRLGNIEWIEKYLKVKGSTLQKTLTFLHGKGSAMAFFSFVPIVGDLLSVSLGYMRANCWIAGSSMLLGKFLRYLVWMDITYGILHLFN